MPLVPVSALALAAAVTVMALSTLAAEVPVFAVDPAIAAMTPEQKVAAREAAMKEDGGLLRTVSKAGATPDAVASIDKVLQNFTNFPALFSDDTRDLKSFALPAVWEQFDDFTGILDEGKADLLSLRQAASAGDDAGFGDALKAVGNACGQCHQTYRAALH